MRDSFLIDISRITSRLRRGRIPTGIDRVCLAYVARYGKQAQAVLQWGSWRRILPYGESQDLFALLVERPPDFARQVARAIARACFPPWPSQDAQGRISFNVGHTSLDDSGLGPWLRKTHQRPVYLLHDLIPLTHPEYCREGEAERHGARLQMLLRTGAGVLTNSQATLDDLRGFAHSMGLPCPPVVAAPLGAPALSFEPGQPAPLERPYFVVLGTIEPRKNLLLLLHIWRQMIGETGGHTPSLVVLGQRGWECENVVDLLERCPALRGFVHEMPSCSDVELAQYLGHARALLFPSFAEGYGLPLIEALALGTPVIASALPVFREVAGDVPEYLNPLDGSAWMRAVRDFAACESPRRNAQLQRLAGFRTPTWSTHFERVDGLLEMLG